MSNSSCNEIHELIIYDKQKNFKEVNNSDLRGYVYGMCCHIILSPEVEPGEHRGAALQHCQDAGRLPLPYLASGAWHARQAIFQGAAREICRTGQRVN